MIQKCYESMVNEEVREIQNLSIDGLFKLFEEEGYDKPETGKEMYEWCKQLAEDRVIGKFSNFVDKNKK